MKDLSSPQTIWVLKIIVILLFLFLASPSQAADPLDVVMNEIAWMGTKANSSDEWLELYNNTNQTISLEGWGLYEAGGKILIEPLTGIIEVKSYYLIERTNDATINNIPANQEPSSWGGYGLKNSGEHLQLLNQNSVIIDEVDCLAAWFAGEASPDYKTMERKNPQTSGSDPTNWATNNGSTINGKDAEGNSINGTPKAKNSVSITTEPPPTQPEPELPPQEEKTQPEFQPELQSKTEELKPITYPSGIIINEILPDPEGIPDAEGEYIEIFNENRKKINLSGWKIADAVGSSAKTYTFPKDIIIEEEGFLVFYRATTKIILNNDGDGVSLIQPDGKVVDSVTYKEKALKGESYNRIESGWTWSTILTPGSVNIVPSPILETEATKSDKEKTGEPTPSKESQEAQKELAAIGEQIPKSSKSLYVLLIALGLAIFSGIIILILKKKLKKQNLIYRKN